MMTDSDAEGRSWAGRRSPLSDRNHYLRDILHIFTVSYVHFTLLALRSDGHELVRLHTQSMYPYGLLTACWQLLVSLPFPDLRSV